MFFSAPQIVKSIEALERVHPFHGITFLTCKKEELPVGNTKNFVMDAQTAAFMTEHHKIDPESEYFLQPFEKLKWVRSDYPSSGLQAINTQTFASAFIHDRGTSVWGWADGYVSVLQSKLKTKKKEVQLIPAFELSIWLYKDKEWPSNTTPKDVINYFLREYHITDSEKVLFDISAPQQESTLFSNKKTEWADLRTCISSPPDAKPDQGGTLTYLETDGVGPAEKFVLKPADRLTLITGDNGLGKTFLLECAWWALTGTWADRPAYPNLQLASNKAAITFEIEGKHSKAERKTIPFDWKAQTWLHPKNRPTIPGLIVYARVDGSFAVWDPAKQAIRQDHFKSNDQSVFTSLEVWDGLPGQIEGLIRDWVTWQNNPQKYPFDILLKVLNCLSPPDLGTLQPGQPVRIPDDPREIPTLIHSYGEIPILSASAGVKRIITLAYLIVWAWNEHLIAALQRRTPPQKRMVILIDEMEAHLHPRWQRSVLPALMSISDMLSKELESQFIIATHSPLVMASSETVFDNNQDSLFHLDLQESGRITLKEIDFVKWGDVSSWLTSPVFELRHARSNEAESAIEKAKVIQLKNNPTKEEIVSVTAELVKYLAQDDKFWPRWVAYAEKYGVQI